MVQIVQPSETSEASFSHDDKLLIFLISVYTRLLPGWLLLRLKETLGIRLVMLYINFCPKM